MNREQGIYERDFMNVYSFFREVNEIIPIFKVYLVLKYMLFLFVIG